MINRAMIMPILRCHFLILDWFILVYLLDLLVINAMRCLPDRKLHAVSDKTVIKMIKLPVVISDNDHDLALPRFFLIVAIKSFKGTELFLIIFGKLFPPDQGC